MPEQALQLMLQRQQHEAAGAAVSPVCVCGVPACCTAAAQGQGLRRPREPCQAAHAGTCSSMTAQQQHNSTTAHGSTPAQCQPAWVHEAHSQLPTGAPATPHHDDQRGSSSRNSRRHAPVCVFKSQAAHTLTPICKHVRAPFKFTPRSLVLPVYTAAARVRTYTLACVCTLYP